MNINYRISYAFVQLPNTAIADYTDTIIAALTGNAGFPALPVSLLTLGTQKDGLPDQTCGHGARRHAGDGGQKCRARCAHHFAATDGGLCAKRGVEGPAAVDLIGLPAGEHQPRAVAARHAIGAGH